MVHAPARYPAALARVVPPLISSKVVEHVPVPVQLPVLDRVLVHFQPVPAQI